MDDTPSSVNEPADGLLRSLATAILMADPDDSAGLEVVRERLSRVDPSWFGPEAQTVEEIAAGALELVEQLRSGASPNGEAVLEELGRAVGDLVEMAAAAAARQSGSHSAQPAPRAGPDGQPAGGDAHDGAPLAEDQELLAEFADSASEYLDTVDAVLLSPGDDDGAVDTMFRAFHTVKGMAGFMGLTEVSEVAHDAEALLAEARTSGAALADDQHDAVLTAVATLRELI